MKPSLLRRMTELRRRVELRRKKAMAKRNAKRRKIEWGRAYGSLERVQWMQSLGCLICGRPAENAHIETGGMSRKADADRTVPLCAEHHRTGPDSFHRLGSAEAFDERHGVCLKDEAKRVNDAWERLETVH